jgi:hypothetical protein
MRCIAGGPKSWPPARRAYRADGNIDSMSDAAVG